VKKTDINVVGDQTINVDHNDVVTRKKMCSLQHFDLGCKKKKKHKLR